MSAQSITFTLNGQAVTRSVPVRQNLADFLRDTMRLTGTHVGCEQGICGACTVRIDGAIARGCLTLAVQADGRRIDTIEGLAEAGELSALQRAFHERNALQCGFCTSGMLLTAHELTSLPQPPDREQIRDHMSGNFCRCTGYQAIVDAVESACHDKSVHAEAKKAEAGEGYIGMSVARPNARKILFGRGSYVDDVNPARQLHAAFLRSPYAHARIVGIDISDATVAPGIVRIFTGADIAARCTPWTGVLTQLKELRSVPQYPMAVDVARWQGEPVALVVAETRAEAEDALELIAVEWEELDPVVDAASALEAPPIHAELGDNVAYDRRHVAGDPDQAFAEAAFVVEETFTTGRHTGVCLEPRSILADYSPADGTLTVHASSQVPHMMQSLLAKHLGLAECDVRVICNDVGGAFGIKVHLYGDEVATAAAACALGRPVKFVADRLESFVSDVHSRDHEVKARIAVDSAGKILAFEIDDLSPIGAYSSYPRGSANEAKQIVNLIGAQYASEHYKARARLVFQNKALLAQYRGVGHPVACMVTEGLVDLAARRCGMDPIAFRKLNLVPDEQYPRRAPSGVMLEGLSHHQCLDRLVELMDYDGLRARQAEARLQGRHLGIGIATFIEMTNPSHATYGIGGAPISSQDGCTVQLLPSGAVACMTGTTDQGQGNDTVIAQVIATALGIALDTVRVSSGDTRAHPFGGGTWGSRGAGIGGEAALQAAKALKVNILEVAGILLQTDASELDIRNGGIVDVQGRERMSLAEIGRTVYFRNDLLPRSFQPEMMVTRHFRQNLYDGIATNGVQASLVEVDTQTGFLKLLHHWVVEDCGVILNPQLVDEQIRGGVAQGLGAALFEELVYSSEGQLTNGSLMDYLVPMAGDLPDITVAHVVTPTLSSELGAKGAGEAGTAAAAAAVLNAVNDALQPFGVKVAAVPLSPDRLLGALGHLGAPATNAFKQEPLQS